MIKPSLLLPLAALLAAADVSKPFDWSTADLSYIGEYAAEYRASRALCAAQIHAEPPPTDRPSTAQVATLKGCSSEALYYGIGMPADPVKARQCAFAEIEGEQYGGPSQPYFGKGMLAIIYANGVGAKQDYDVAVHMACGLDNAAAETGPRIDRLAKLRAANSPRSQVDACLDTSSGALGGMCAAHHASLDEQAREQRIARLAGSWAAPQRQAYDRLRNSAETYASTLHEMDCFRGAAQTQCTIDGANDFMANFARRIETLGKGGAAQLETRAMATRRSERQRRSRKKPII